MSDTQAETEALLPTERQLRTVTHGHTLNRTYSPTYQSWQSMLARCRQGDHRMSEVKLLGCPFCGGEPVIKSHRWAGNNEVKAHYVHCQKCNANSHGRNTVEKTVAFWNTRAQPKPEVAPDDEALILNFESAIEVLSDPDRDEYADEVALAQAELDLNAAREALRRRFAELRAALKRACAIGEGLAARAKAAEASLEQTNGIYRISLEKQVICERRAKAAEAALAACRDKTIEECAEVSEGFDEAPPAVGRWIAAEIRALKTKEPTNG